MNTKYLKDKALEMRMSVLHTVETSGSGHIASSFSCVEILVALYYGGILRHRPYEPNWEGRDRFILSKGHAATILYSILANRGYFPESELELTGKINGKMGVHLEHSIPGAEITTGSLACGFGIAAGIALSAKLDRKLWLTFTLLGDAECYEGAIWETAMFAAHNRLNNLVVIIDHNHMGCTGFIEDGLGIEPLDKKWESFGFDVLTIDGHDFESILKNLHGLRSRKSAKPLCIIADTVKAKGLPSVENTLLCHGYMPKGEALKAAQAEVEGRSL